MNAFGVDAQRDVASPSEFLVIAPICTGHGTPIFNGNSTGNLTLGAGMLMGCYKQELFTDALYQDGHVSGGVVQTLNDTMSEAGKRRWMP